MTQQDSLVLADRNRLEEALRRSEDRLRFLLALSDALRPLSDPLDVQEVAARLLGEHLQVTRVSYAEIEGRQIVMRREYARGVPPLAASGPLRSFGEALGEAFRRGETLVVDDVQVEPRFTDFQRAELKNGDILAFVAVLLVKGGRLMAAFGASHVRSRHWTPAEVELVRDVAERTWEAVERARAEASLRKSKERLQFLVTLNESLRRLKDPVEIQEVMVRLLGEHLRVNRVSYATIEGDEFNVIRCYASGVAPLFGRGPLVAFGEQLVDAYRRGETIAVNDVRVDPRFLEHERVALVAIDIVAFVGVMVIKDGRLVADFCVHSATERVWTRDEIELIEQAGESTWATAERACAEAALREREDRLRLALDASAGGSWTWDIRTNHIDWDEGLRRRYRFAPEEPPSFEAWLSRVHEDDRPQVLSILGEIQQTTRNSWDSSFRIVRPDGAIAWIQSLGRADRGPDGQLARLTGLEFDITERRRAEEALQARRDEERDRELRMLLETAAQGIVSVDAEGLIVTANRALEAMFGWTAGELIGQSIERLVPLSARDIHRRHRTDYFAAPDPRAMGADLELIGQRKDGTTFPIEVSLNHIVTPGGGHAIAFVTDVTQRKRTEATLQDRTTELENRTMQLSQLASDLTLAEQHAREQLAKTLHDGLQQLLVSASLNLDRQVKRDAQRGAGAAEPLVQARRHLDAAISAARSLSLELFPPLLHGSGLPAALIWLAERTGNEYGIEVHVSADPLANSDRKDVRTLLFESVRELLLNAVKHGHVDRVSVELVRGPDDTLCVTVIDQGSGFDPSVLGDRARAGQLGWGLFSIRERLTLLGGRFAIESAPGEGTRVSLVAPRGIAEDAVAAPTSLSRAGTVLAASGDHPAPALRILIADDHAGVREVFREMLQERRELRVIGEAANGLEAITKARALHPDIILMDVLMPEMDGIEATRRIREELPAIEILAFSTHPPAEKVHAIERAGAAAFFTKGVDTQRLIDHLMILHATSAQLADRAEANTPRTPH